MDVRLAEILKYVPESMRPMLNKTLGVTEGILQEIRIRCGLPLIVETSQGGFAVLPSGELSPAVGGAYIIKAQDLKKIFQAICDNSVYAFTEDIKQGFITIRGGHRVGITGRATVGCGRIESFREISSLNIRIAKEAVGAANEIVDSIIMPNGIKNTLLIAPPLGGKTTVLRDLARQISDRGIKTGIADDRGEIACLYRGVPQNDVGVQTDVIENAAKEEAVTMLLRSMSPEVIITDEICTKKDADAIKSCFGTGVSVIATAHGTDCEEVLRRPDLKELFGSLGFKQIIRLYREGTGLNTRVFGTALDVSL